MPANVATDRAVARILRLCAQELDATALRVQVIAKLRRALHFDAFVWVLTDPMTCVGSAPLAEVPCLEQLPRLIRLKYSTPINRWTSLPTNEVALLRSATDGDLSRSLLWQDMLSAYDVCDIASCVFRDRFGTWGFMDLWRTGKHEPFTTSQVRVLREVLGDLTAALRRTQAASFGPVGPTGPRHVGATVLLLGSDLDVLAQTPETQAYLAELLPPTEQRSPIPAIAYNVAAQLVANETGIDDHAPFTRVHLRAGRWLTLRAARVTDRHPPVGANIAVSIEQTPPADRLSLFAAAFGLSPRESELLTHLATGRDTKEIAKELFLSEHTVHDHLKSMFAKTGMRGRSLLLSSALGASPAANN